MSSAADNSGFAEVEKRPHSTDGSADVPDDKRETDVSILESQSDLSQQDEALRLVGRERQAEFSEEFNKRLRRKLVRHLYTSLLSSAFG